MGGVLLFCVLLFSLSFFLSLSSYFSLIFLFLFFIYVFPSLSLLIPMNNFLHSFFHFFLPLIIFFLLGILIHCREGLSRSPSILLSYLLLRQHHSLAKAMEYLTTGRRTSHLSPPIKNHQVESDNMNGQDGVIPMDCDTQDHNKIVDQPASSPDLDHPNKNHTTENGDATRSTTYTPQLNDGFKRQLMILESRLIAAQQVCLGESPNDLLPACCDCWMDDVDWDGFLSPLSASSHSQCDCDCHKMEFCTVKFFEKETRVARLRSRERLAAQKEQEAILTKEMRRSDGRTSKSIRPKRRPNTGTKIKKKEVINVCDELSFISI
jgi:hypothetical protein